MKEQSAGKKLIWIWDVGLILLAILSTAKLLVADINVDEEYVVAMSYRIAAGDGMFQRIWEPHQTSGYLSALLIGLYRMFHGSMDYLVIYLRVCGGLLEAAMAFLVYGTVKKRYPQQLAFGVAMLSFLVLPKWGLVPEFTDIMLWSSVCTSACLLRAAYGEKHTGGWICAAAVFTCMMVLSYPTALLVVPFYVWGILRMQGRRNAVIYIATCMAAGIGYLGYFVSRLSVAGLLSGIRQMASDESHHMTFGDKCISWLEEISSMLPAVAIMIFLTAVLCYALRWKDRMTRLQVFLVLVTAHQAGCWLFGKSGFLLDPMLFFYVAYLMGCLVCFRSKELFWFAFVPGGVICISVLLLTVTGVKATGVFLLPGILAVFPALYEHKDRERVWNNAAMTAFLVLLLFGRLFYIYGNHGYKEDIFYVKQKALSGPLKGVYCAYSDGYEYNLAAELLEQYVTADDVLLCADIHSTWYLLSDAKIGHFSTISTIDYGDRLLRYWELFPDRYPDYVLGQQDTDYVKKVATLLPLEEYAVNENMVLFRVKK